MFEYSYVKKWLLLEALLNRIRVLGDGFEDLCGINFLFLEEFGFEDSVFFWGVMIGEPLEEEDEAVFPGANGSKEVLDIFLKLFGVFIFANDLL